MIFHAQLNRRVANGYGNMSEEQVRSFEEEQEAAGDKSQMLYERLIRDPVIQREISGD